jgi:hypothetical protein
MTMTMVAQPRPPLSMRAPTVGWTPRCRVTSRLCPMTNTQMPLIASDGNLLRGASAMTVVGMEKRR